jgi:hypothetical protein
MVPYQIGCGVFRDIICLNLSHNLFTEIEGDAPFLYPNKLETLDIHSNIITRSVPALPQNIIYIDCHTQTKRIRSGYDSRHVHVNTHIHARLEKYVNHSFIIIK